MVKGVAINQLCVVHYELYPYIRMTKQIILTNNTNCYSVLETNERVRGDMTKNQADKQKIWEVIESWWNTE